jgi:hypothetical protein
VAAIPASAAELEEEPVLDDGAGVGAAPLPGAVPVRAPGLGAGAGAELPTVQPAIAQIENTRPRWIFLMCTLLKGPAPGRGKERRRAPDNAGVTSRAGVRPAAADAALVGSGAAPAGRPSVTRALRL